VYVMGYLVYATTQPKASSERLAPSELDETITQSLSWPRTSPPARSGHDHNHNHSLLSRRDLPGSACLSPLADPAGWKPSVIWIHGTSGVCDHAQTAAANGWVKRLSRDDPFRTIVLNWVALAGELHLNFLYWFTMRPRNLRL
jgi:hypothetical protein